MRASLSKTPTTILFDKDQKFHSFGYEAEKHYFQLTVDDNHTDWYYFRRFKMILFDIEGKGGQASKVMLKDIRDREVPAVKVFSEAIRYLKGHTLNELEKRCTGVTDADIEWVLTVPATSNESVKQFMRLAAKT
ncbi:heat shock 70 kDa protein 12B-like, partial [Pecten maximus]|uniref:heat shock 70 kDa protein 12B-like n=1 Tax=Pecten maximus TaxID=6579 RepID=UPI0014587102